MKNANVYVKTDIKANKQLYKYMIHKYQQHVLYCDLLNIRNAIKWKYYYQNVEFDIFWVHSPKMKIINCVCGKYADSSRSKENWIIQKGLYYSKSIPSKHSTSISTFYQSS